MKFKIGDKVKVIYNSNGSGIVKQAMGKIGIVGSMSNSEQFGMIYVQFDKNVFSDLSLIGFFRNEIEKISEKGKQLEFAFME